MGNFIEKLEYYRGDCDDEWNVEECYLVVGVGLVWCCFKREKFYKKFLKCYLVIF